MHSRFFIFLLFPLPFCSLAQQAGPIAHKPDSVVQFGVIRAADAMAYTFTAPTRWNGKQWLTFGGIVAGTAALTLADQPVREFGTSGKTKFLNGVNTVGDYYGRPYTGLVLSSGLYITGFLLKSDWAKETGLILGTSLLTAGIIESTLKPIFGRARPFENEGNYDFTYFNKDAAYHSFPSGHASMAFTISLVMARRVPSVPVKILFYSLAASTAMCRIYSDQHWVSDVAFGGVIAWFCSDVMIKRMEKNKYSRINKNFKFRAVPYARGISLRATF